MDYMSKGLGPQKSLILNVHGALPWTESLKLNLLRLRRKPKILGCLLKRCRLRPSPPTITVGGSDFVVFEVATLASHYHSGRPRLCRLCHSQPSPPTITAGGSDFVVFVVEASSQNQSHFHRGQRHTRNKILEAATGTRTQNPG